MSKSLAQTAAYKDANSGPTRASATFVRPADTTAYASGDLVADSTTAGSVTPMPFLILANPNISKGAAIKRARVRKTSASVTNASFRLHLYSDIPVPANGDNGAWSTSKALNYIGSLDVTVDEAYTDGAAGTGVPKSGTGTDILTTSATIYGLLEARAAYTPTSAESFNVELEFIVQ